jgi:hypothetical protein
VFSGDGKQLLSFTLYHFASSDSQLAVYLPGRDWITLLLERGHDLVVRFARNTNKALAVLKEVSISQYTDNLNMVMETCLLTQYSKISLIRTNWEQPLVQIIEELLKIFREVVKWPSCVFLGNTTLSRNLE